MHRFSENLNLIYALKPGDHQAGVDGDSFHAGRMRRFALLIQFATLTGDAVLTVASGATAGTKTTNETFRYRLADADQGGDGADQFGDWATSSSLTLTAATYSDRLLVVEMDSDELTDGQPWVTPSLSAAADALNASIVALGEPRFAAHDAPTVIA